MLPREHDRSRMNKHISHLPHADNIKSKLPQPGLDFIDMLVDTVAQISLSAVKFVSHPFSSLEVCWMDDISNYGRIGRPSVNKQEKQTDGRMAFSDGQIPSTANAASLL